MRLDTEGWEMNKEHTFNVAFPHCPDSDHDIVFSLLFGLMVH